MSDTLAKNMALIEAKLENTGAKLIAVTKTKPVNILQGAYNLGLRQFGENKVQEMVEKYNQLPKDIAWHLIGHLQTNKVKYIAQFVAYIHSVDSLKLLAEINKQAAKNERVINCLLQIYIANEATKFGLNESELFNILESEEIKNFENIKIIGLMGMATNTDDTQIIKNEFQNLKLLFDLVKNKYSTKNINFSELSMGMSSDFELAIEQGSTMVRVGSSLFGNR